MAVIYFSWDGSIALTSNCIAYRCSKRLKDIAGAWGFAGFTPANDMALSVNAASTLITANRVYECRVEMICITGGPTLNVNGIQEGIVFECIDPVLGADSSDISVSIDMVGTNIEKARLTLRRQDNNLLVGGPVIVNTIAGAVNHTFTGLDGNTGYYLLVEYYATVNGIEVISSDPAFLGAPCGGNVSGYQITTSTACVTLSIESPDNAQIEWVDCNGNALSTAVLTPINICTNGDPVNIVSGTLIISGSTPGEC